jgi:tRNA(fMet)-specific endonuclease VapC
MVVLDTNHLREYTMGTPPGERLKSRLLECGETPVITVTTVEEVLRGRLAKVASAKSIDEEVAAANLLVGATRMLGLMSILPWDEESGLRFREMRSKGVRIGTMDLRIACMTIEYGAVLLTRNTVDFAKVPGLKFENWLD